MGNTGGFQEGKPAVPESRYPQLMGLAELMELTELVELTQLIGLTELTRLTELTE